MDDLVKRLRDGGETCGIERCRVRDAASGCMCAIAADRIEALEAALRQIAYMPMQQTLGGAGNYNALQLAARAALGEKKDG